MLKLVVLTVLIASSIASPVLGGGRIVNGTNAAPGEIPYIVSVLAWDRQRCGGSILDETHVLTAAHCLDASPAYAMMIQYGDTRIERSTTFVQVAEAVRHEDYDSFRAYANDVAVLTLESPIIFSEFVQPVVLPEQGEAPPAGDTSILAGWGYNSSTGVPMDDLQRVDLLVYSDEDCKAAHKSTDPKYHVCSGVPEGGKGQCGGDSGGPLVANGKQIGVVSWSVKPCGIPGKPGVYARVSSYVDWINKQRQ